MKPTQEQIWKAAVALTASTKWVTLPGAVLSALTLAEIFERHTEHLGKPGPIPTRMEPTQDEWNLAWEQVVAWRRTRSNDGGIDFCKRVSADAYHLAAERAKEKP